MIFIVSQVHTGQVVIPIRVIFMDLFKKIFVFDRTIYQQPLKKQLHESLLLLFSAPNCCHFFTHVVTRRDQISGRVTLHTQI